MVEASRLSTGVGPLDRYLDGGLPAGSLVAVTAPPESQSELLLYELVANHPALYVSTVRSAELMADVFDRLPFDVGDPAVHYAEPARALDAADDYHAMAGEGGVVVVDPVNVLETKSRDRYQEFLNAFANHMRNVDGVGVLHCHRTDPEPDLRSVTAAFADVVLTLERDVDGTYVDHYLGLAKHRGGLSPEELLKLDFGQRVSVDTSRDIA